MLILERQPSSTSTTTSSSDSQATSVESEGSSSIPKVETKHGISGGHPTQTGKAREVNETEGGSNSLKTNGDITVPRVFDSKGNKTAKWTRKSNITLDFPNVFL